MAPDLSAWSTVDTRRHWGDEVVKLYVEGGREATLLKTACRKGFATFLEKAGLVGCMPRVVACGSRSQAYSDFCRAIERGEAAMLLIDSEEPVIAAAEEGIADALADDGKGWRPWLHLKQSQRDRWKNRVAVKTVTAI